MVYNLFENFSLVLIPDISLEPVYYCTVIVVIRKDDSSMCNCKNLINQVSVDRNLLKTFTLTVIVSW